MRRRDLLVLLGGASAAMARGVQRAQAAGEPLQVGIVTLSPEAAPQFAAFRQRLAELGPTIGAPVAIEFRSFKAKRNGSRVPSRSWCAGAST
jgi:hypothetical protein